MVVCVDNNSGSSADTINGVTYDGVSMTQIQTKESEGEGQGLYAYYLLGPAIGTHDIVTSYTENATGNNVDVSAASYSGASLTGQLDNSQGGAMSTAGQNSVTKSLTTSADNAWVVLCTSNANSANVAGTGSTLRTGASPTATIFDSNGGVHPAGSYGMSWSWGGNSYYEYIQLSIVPN
jgi:hypothetical protein